MNFYDIGDVVAAADVLNGVGPIRATTQADTRSGCGRSATCRRPSTHGRADRPTAHPQPPPRRRVGAVVGLVVGLLARAIVGSGSLVVYEIVAGAAGLVLGAILGAFYGGAISLPRRGR